MKFETPRGTRDFGPEEMARRNWVLSKIQSVYEKYGYSPLETPAFERMNVLSAKSSGGEEVIKEIFKFKDKGDRLMGLRFDLTVPMARFIAKNPDLPKPFKRSQIGRVWRYEEPQAGRFREFWQADVDVIGSSEPESEVDPLSAVISALKELGFRDFEVKVNSRPLMEELANSIGIKRKRSVELFRIVDKLEKQGEKAVIEELKEKGFSKAEDFLDILKKEGKPEEILSEVSDRVKKEEAISDLLNFFKTAKSFGIYNYLTLDLSLARGLDYYTGVVYEIKIKGMEKYGSVAGGGRYDNLIGMYGNEKQPAVGLSIGVERILEIMKDKRMFPELNKIKALVIPVGEKAKSYSFELTEKLREKGISSDVDLLNRGPSKLLNYANSLSIPYCILIGDNELEESKVTLKDMKSGEQEMISEEKLLKKLS
ncbi:MAG: histidine--tRNA ligase [Candidatus Undinarchaeales archaeon]